MVIVLFSVCDQTSDGVNHTVHDSSQQDSLVWFYKMAEGFVLGVHMCFMCLFGFVMLQFPPIQNGVMLICRLRIDLLFILLNKLNDM